MHSGARLSAPALGYLAVLFAATAGTLALFGRRLWCAAGDLVPWAWETPSQHSSQHLLDPYSFTHIEHGILFFAALALLAPRTSVRARFLIALTVEGAWEILENSSFIIDRYRAQTVDVGYYGDSILNSLADMGWCALGFHLTARLRWWWTLALVAGFELALALTIRDNLVLNILMLIHPFDAILAWQKGG
jgi:hypothetical protein